MLEQIQYLRNRSRQKGSESIFENIANGRKKALENWFDDQWRKLRSIIKSLLSISEDLEKVEEFLQDAVAQHHDFLEAFILNSNGSVAFTSYRPHISLDFQKYPNYMKGLKDEAYMYGPYCDPATLDIPTPDKHFSDDVTLLFSAPYHINDELFILCIRILNDDMSNIIQEEDTHIYKDSGDNYLFMIQNNRNIPVGTALSRSRFEDQTFTKGENLKSGVKTSHWGTVKINSHTEFEIRFVDPATKKLHPGVQATIDKGENLDCWPGYPDYRHILVGGKGTTITPPHSDETWGMMCEADILEMYRFTSISTALPLTLSFLLGALQLIQYYFIHRYPNISGLMEMIFIALLFLSTYILIRHLLTRPLQGTIQILKEAAEGDGNLTRRVESSSANEIGELACWFNKFMNTQKHMIKRVGSAVKTTKGTLKHVDSASKRIENAITDIQDTITTLSQNSVEQNILFKNTQGEVKKISDSFQKNDELNDMIQHIQEKANCTTSTASNAMNITSEVMNSIRELEEAMNKTLRSINTLSDKSDKITDITKTISDISKKTNLLALNASIEAANAGKAGLGFSVVANEIKQLSQDTQTATNVIAELVHSIQEEITTTKDAVDIIDKKVENSIRSSKESADAVSLVVDASENIHHILSIMNEQNQLIRTVRHNIKDMAEQSQQVVETGEECSVLAERKLNKIIHQTAKMKQILESLKYSSDDLEELVNAFTLDEKTT